MYKSKYNDPVFYITEAITQSLINNGINVLIIICININVNL
jgi:hypothetical protein